MTLKKSTKYALVGAVAVQAIGCGADLAGVDRPVRFGVVFAAWLVAAGLVFRVWQAERVAAKGGAR